MQQYIQPEQNRQQQVAVLTRTVLSTHERAERLYLMGELAAAVDLLIRVTIQ